MIKVYVNGSCVLIENIMWGYADVFFGKDDPRNFKGKLSSDIQTPLKAEIMACILALNKAGHDQNVNIITKSDYVVRHCTQYLHAWHDNGWLFEDSFLFMHKKLWIHLYDIIKERNAKNTITKWTYVENI